MANATLTAAEWLHILSKRFDDQAAHIQGLRSYMFENGAFPPLPEMNKKTRPAWELFQRKACPALAPLIVASTADRIRYQGVVVGETRTELEDIAKRIARDSMLETAISDAVYSALVDGEAYLQTSKGADGKAVVTAEDRRFTIVAPEPLRPHIARAALKVFRDLDYMTDHAYLFTGTQRMHYTRPLRDAKKQTITKVNGGWTQIEAIPLDGVPFSIIRPSASGMGLFEPHLETINRVSWTTLIRLAVTAQQGFPQRIIESTEGLPVEDSDGNAIDSAGMFAADPGSIWDAGPGNKITQLSAASLQELLLAEREDRRELAAVTRTSLGTINPSEGSNQSAEGALAAKEEKAFMVAQIIARAVQPAAELALVRAIKIEAPGAITDDDTVTMQFAAPNRVSEAERWQSMSLAKAADVPFRTRMLTIGGYSADEVDRMEAERLSEQMTLEALLATPVEGDDEIPVDPETP